MSRGYSQFNIAIVDDHQLFRSAVAGQIQAITRDLEAKIQIDITISADNGMDFMKKLETAVKPSLVILDINMPLMDGWETLKWIREKENELKVMILTMHCAPNYIRRAIKDGANSYLTKEVSPAILQNAILQTLQFGFYYTDSVVKALLDDEVVEPEEGVVATATRIELTPRELQFLKYLASSDSYAQIAARMNVSPRTADGYRESIFAKLGTSSRVGAVVEAMRIGFLKI